MLEDRLKISGRLPAAWRVGAYELDPVRFELRKDGAAQPIEPQVLSLILLLVRRRDRLVTRDDLIEEIWNGRFVSDAAVSSRIKSARQALGDDGRGQRMIRTVHGKGFRFVGEVEEVERPAEPAVLAEPAEPALPDKPSVAVLPFRLIGPGGPHAVIAEALPHELIAELCRLRWLHVIARGSSFRVAGSGAGEVGRILGVRYCLSGSLEVAGDKILVAVELADTRDEGVVWAERYASAAGDVHDIRARIVASLIAALELHIPFNEARHARLAAPEHLDAWSAYHLGLQHMFRFNAADNSAAAAMFAHAIAREPDFARAHAGLSFTHFQNAFLRYTADPAAEAVSARRHAERAVEFDGLDPFVNFAMGRCFWLEGDLEGSLGWLGRATGLSPNYAQGIYATAWAETLLCRGDEGQRHADRAMALSPIDPMHYAMLGTRALSHLVRGEGGEAAEWAERAARAPGAHVLIAVVAVACHAAAGDAAKASAWAADVRRRSPSLTQADFFRSFPFGDPATRARIARSLARFGL